MSGDAIGPGVQPCSQIGSCPVDKGSCRLISARQNPFCRTAILPKGSGVLPLRLSMQAMENCVITMYDTLCHTQTCLQQVRLPEYMHVLQRGSLASDTLLRMASTNHLDNDAWRGPFRPASHSKLQDDLGTAGSACQHARRYLPKFLIL